MQEEARSADAAAEKFKSLPSDIQDDVIRKIYNELRDDDINVRKRPREHDDEESKLGGFMELFEKLPEDSEYRKQFFMLGVPDKHPEELTPEKEEKKSRRVEKRRPPLEVSKGICKIGKRPLVAPSRLCLDSIKSSEDSEVPLSVTSEIKEWADCPRNDYFKVKVFTLKGGSPMGGQTSGGNSSQ